VIPRDGLDAVEKSILPPQRIVPCRLAGSPSLHLLSYPDVILKDVMRIWSLTTVLSFVALWKLQFITSYSCSWRGEVVGWRERRLMADRWGRVGWTLCTSYGKRGTFVVQWYKEHLLNSTIIGLVESLKPFLPVDVGVRWLWRPHPNEQMGCLIAALGQWFYIDILLLSFTKKKKLNSMVWVRERTIPTERPPLVGEVIANLCG
jgi:hypothetical protein